MKRYFVYILASGRNGTLYIGVTSDLHRRLEQHRAGTIKSFTKEYHVQRLVHVDTFDDPEQAIAYEKRIKRWRRAWKLELIESSNPQWRDLADDL